MQARLKQQGDVFVVHLIGRLDVEATASFRKACLGPLAEKRIVFDFTELSFVGSSGIVAFLDVLQMVALSRKDGVCFSGLGPEFAKLVAATPLAAVALFSTATDAARWMESASTPSLPLDGPGGPPAAGLEA